MKRSRSNRQKRKRMFLDKQVRSAECLLTIHEESSTDPIALGELKGMFVDYTR